MKKHLLLILGIVFATFATASPISKEKAKQNAISFLNQRTALNGKKFSTGNMKITQVKIKDLEIDEAPYYIFNIGNNNGFVVTSGDDRAIPILGYTDNGSFNIENIPSNIKNWLKGYEIQINAIKQSSYTANSEDVQYKDIRKEVGVLLTTNWDQGSPYNKKCFKNCPTGCVATALAQVMNYHKWPKEATTEIPGYRMYYVEGDVDMPALDPIVFDWDNMLDTYKNSYSNFEAEAVANLMQYCGQAVEMEYAEAASGAFSYMAAVALRNYFGYDQGLRFLIQEGHSYYEWEDIIYKELENARPVLFAGSGPGGGHEFVCDGYKEGFFHFNWGWSGMSDGYFKLSALYPGLQGTGGSAGGIYEFTSGQQIVIGIQPPVENSVSPEYTPSSGWIALSDYSDNGIYTMDEDGDFNIDIKSHYVYEGEDDGANFKMGVALYNQDQEFVEVLSSGFISFSAGYPRDGDHTAQSKVIVSSDVIGNNNVMYIRPIIIKGKNAELIDGSEKNYIKLNITNQEIKAVAYPKPNLEILNQGMGCMPALTSNMWGQPDYLNMVACVKNNSNETVSGQLDVMLDNKLTYLKNGYENFFSIPQDIILKPGEKKNVLVEFYSSEAGTKNLCLAFNGKAISENISTEFILPAKKSSRIEITSNEQYTSDGDSITLELDVKNMKSKNKYESFITVIMYDLEPEGRPIVVRSMSQMANIEPKQSEKFTFTFRDLDINKGYGFAITYLDSNKLKYFGGLDFYTGLPNNILKTYKTAEAMECWDVMGDYNYSIYSGDVITIPNNACFVNYPSDFMSEQYIKNDNPNCIFRFDPKTDYPGEYTDCNVMKNQAMSKMHLSNSYSYYSPIIFKCSDLELSVKGCKDLTPIYLPFVPDVVEIDGKEATIANDINDKDADCILMPMVSTSSESIYFDFGKAASRSIYMFAVADKHVGKDVSFKIDERVNIDLGTYRYETDDYIIVGASGLNIKNKENLYVFDGEKFIRYNSDMELTEDNKVSIIMKNGYAPFNIYMNYPGCENTMIEDISVENDGVAKIYSIDGKLLKTAEFGDDVLEGLSNGVYIINGRKIVK